MNVKIKGNKIILSEMPHKDINGAFLVWSDKVAGGFKIIDAHILQKEYTIPGGLVKKDIKALYLRIL